MEATRKFHCAIKHNPDALYFKVELPGNTTPEEVNRHLYEKLASYFVIYEETTNDFISTQVSIPTN